MISRGLSVGRVFGSEIRVHLSWVLLLAFLIGSIGAVDLPSRYPLWPVGLSWAVATAAGIGLFLGVLLHEVAHLAVSHRFGVAPAPVTLLLFGAPTTMEGGAGSPGREALIGLAGPVTSIALSILATTLAFAVAGPVASATSGRAATLASAAGEALLSVGVLNGLVGVVNLLPVFPLDGARILRALVWRLAGDPARGSRVAVQSGQIVGIAILGFGFAMLVWGDEIDGIVAVFLGWFVRGASLALGRQQEFERTVAGLVVDEAMDRDLPSVPPQVTLDTFAEVLIGPGETTVLPVVGGDGLLGLVGHSALRRAGRKAWTTLRASDVMARIDQLPVVSPRDSLRPALLLLQISRSDGIPVMDEGRLAGVLTRHGVGRLLHQRVPVRRGINRRA